jgi:tetratricopeptide (TPR) repeat protein
MKRIQLIVVIAVAAMALFSLAAAPALAQTPRNIEEFFKRGVNRYQQGDLDGARQDFDRALELDANLTAAYNNRGVTRKALGDTQGAIADYTEAIKLKPSLTLAFFNRSVAYKALGKGLEAQDDFIRSLGPGEDPEQWLEPIIERLPAKATKQ